MSHNATQDGDLQLETDYVVVGSGAGGAVAAAALARGGRSVTLVEAGPWLDPGDYPSSAWGNMRDVLQDSAWNLARGRSIWPVVQARAVGGTTVINSAIAVRTPEDLFEAWARDHGVDGLRDRVLAHEETLLEELSASPTDPDNGRHNRLAVDGADRVGYANHPTLRFVKDCAGSGQCLQGCRGGRKQSVNLVFVPQVLQQGGHVLSCAPVDRVLLEGRRAVGVTGRFRHPWTRSRGGTFRVNARRAVVVAASATGSPALLLRSGVRNRQLGREFRAHPGTGIFGVYDDPVDMNSGATQGWASMAFRDKPGFKLETLSIPIELVAGRLKGGGTGLVRLLGQYRHFAMWVMAVRAESVGRISRGFGGRPTIAYGLDDADMAKMREAAYRLALTHFAAGAKAVIPGIHGMPVQIGPDEVELLREAPLSPRCWLAILSHLFGGCVFGRDPARSVCDGRGAVHGYDGLYVADASLIPTNLGVNPQLTIMGLARFVAEEALNR